MLLPWAAKCASTGYMIWPYLSKELSIKDMTVEFMFSSSAAIAAAFLSMFYKQHPSFSNNKWVSEVAQY